ncbi:hypothetical protein [Xylanimonas ulmi]|uniref:Methyltransferase family protein n=1 Tax=Xylanimonas ulmi TaxID=228973 RepID=A0A4Q7M0F4_9MICO|nr:hypothetical protein [Xylanibacterium ulmi]RZS60641.1 hypothetical protein EV386_0911 [Xylanibacterium ulmi]
MSLPDDPRAVRTRADHQALDDAETTSAQPALQAIGRELWLSLHRLGFPGGHVLVQGDGADALLNRPDAHLPGVATICATVGHPGQDLLDPDTPFRGGLDAYDVAVTVMPHADVELATPSAIVTRTLLHATLAWATLRCVKPGGLAAIITNHLTLDAHTPRSRIELEAVADLIGAVRLPSGTLRPHLPGTDSVTDILLFTRRPDGQPSRSRDFADTVHVPLDGRRVRLNTYFDQRPEHILGATAAIHHPGRPPILTVTGLPGMLRSDLHEALGHITALAHRDGLTRPPAEHQPGMHVLAIHHEAKAPHNRRTTTSRAPTPPASLPRHLPETPGPYWN